MKAYLLHHDDPRTKIISVAVANTMREAIIITENRIGKKLPTDVLISQIEIRHGTMIVVDSYDEACLTVENAYFGLN